MQLPQWFRPTIATRVAFSLMLLSISSFLTALQFTRLKNADNIKIEQRRSIAEALAISSSLFAERREESRIKANLQAVLQRNEDILSGCVRLEDGRPTAVVGSHQEHWPDGINQASDEVHMTVPISRGNKPWGRLELTFANDYAGIWRYLQHPLWGVGAILLVLNFSLFRWYLGRILRYLNPTTAVPEHVRSTLDTFAEGVVVLDNQYRIVLANMAFSQHVGKSLDELVGKDVDSFGWSYENPMRWLPGVISQKIAPVLANN